jgi:lysozyme
MTHAISPAGLALIQEFEGFRAEPAQLPDGNWVVGFGHVRVGEPGAAVTEAQAADLLEMDVAPIEAAVNAHVTTSITQSQFDALVAFVLSIGVDAFAQSQVLRRVNAGAFVAAANAMDAWRKCEVDGELVIVEALVRRRAAERALFLKDQPQGAAPSAALRAKLDYAASVLGAPIEYAPAPAFAAAPAPVAVQAEATPAQRLTEILKSEPATEALLLTHVVPQEDADEEGEIVTAHAKPAARRTDSFPKPDRRIARMRKRARFLAHFTNFNVSHSLENVGLAALFLFGVGLTVTGGSMFYASQGDLIQIAGASAFAAPGLAAMLMAGFGMFHRPQPQAVEA